MMKRIFYILAAITFVVSVYVENSLGSENALPIQGKGMYLWKLWTSNGGGKNLDAVIAKLHSIGATWLVIKMGDSNNNWNSSGNSLYSWAVTNYGSMDSVVAVFHNGGIKLLAFQYIYGKNNYANSLSEADVANAILNVKNIDGLIIDAEIEFDTLTNRTAVARAYCDSIRAHHPASLVGLTAWARVNGHTTFPWTTFLDRCDVNMPQTYWAARPTTPSNELNLMNSQFTSYTNTWVSQGDTAARKPIMPIGQGEYFGYSSDVQQGDVASFCKLSDSTYHYQGVSLWEYNQITHQYVWDEYAAGWHLLLVAPKLIAPLSLENVVRNPTFVWHASNATQYHLQIQSDTLFNTIVLDTVVTDTAITVSTLLDANTQYFWHVSSINSTGESSYSEMAQFTTGSAIAAVGELAGAPKVFSLSQNYPNPFNPTTVIGYQLPKDSYVTLKVYDILGKEVTTLVNRRQNAGYYNITFHAANFSSGVYFYRLTAGNFTDTKKFLLMK